MKKFLRFFLIISIAGLLLLVLLYLVLSYMQEPQTLNEKSRAALRGSFVKLKQGYVHYELKGPDTGNVVVLIHGAGSGYYAWDHNFDALVQKGYRVLRYDLYGRGYSDRPELDYDLELFRGQLVQLLDTLGLDKDTINLVGVSMGTTIAIDYAERNSAKVNHLVMVDPASLGMGAAPWFVTKPIVAPLLFTFYWRPRAVDKQMKEFHDKKAVPEYRPKTEDQMKFAGFKRAIRSTWIHTLGLNMTASMDKIASGNIKTHLIWGKSDPLVPHQASQEYLKHMPKSSLDVIEHAGHLSNYEKPQEVNTLLNSFFRE